ncbi:MAG TPA: NADH-quinone oxidoreductase subunit I [Chloroflexota bacterium]|nr:NADH-quinone oxidoreductase subunit I [Chloroflexota bacterium]
MAFGLGVAKGMLTTISHLVRPPVTVQYPEERLDMPIWTRGRPRLIYEVDTGELRCTACGACALACPVDVIKIEQHPSPIKGKVLDRFDIDMADCIECALCVEACPFRAITMAPDFEMAAFERTTELVFDMYELRIPGTPEIDAGMEHIQGVKRGQRGQGAAAPAGGADRPAAAPAAPAARRAEGPVAGQAAGATAAPSSTDATGTQVAEPAAAPEAAVPAGEGADAAAASAAASAAAPTAAAAPTDYDPLTISDEDLKKLPPADRAKVYRARLTASGWKPPPPASKA